MTVKEQIDLIISTISNGTTGLPPLITAANLSQMDDYKPDQPDDSTKKQACCYVGPERDSTDRNEIVFILQFQLPREIKLTEYHDVIMPFLRENITATLLEYESREGIEFEPWPADMTGTSVLWYYLGYSQSLDDCDD